MRAAITIAALLLAYGIVGRIDADVAEAEAANYATLPAPVEIAHAPR
ncbi:hypothetical protein [Denitromonas iodatirespirans]|uniref:Uncharacterized protein n=1 Tax=Denitromonas iodatirespirans TaxID=2795389 RepID=A0A944DAU5_DENI1|nr:hypothetical protein [Denitromonas iodatirespirans]MBT0961696.1 hypothetical protein [Denitromonas iodatirespirans]